jgi:hypothetical protein
VAPRQRLAPARADPSRRGSPRHPRAASPSPWPRQPPPSRPLETVLRAPGAQHRAAPCLSGRPRRRSCTDP